jgi:hypothetical protein
MSKGHGITRVWNEDGSLSMELENINEYASRGKVWDDRGKVRDLFLWNGKPISKNRFLDKLGRQIKSRD